MMVLSKLFRRGMSCHEALEVLQAYLDGEIDEHVARQVAAHLHRCTACENESAVYSKIKGSLGNRRRSLNPEVATALTRYGERVARGEIA